MSSGGLLAGELKSLPPAPDEVEVSLFGPGYGECVLIHPGDGHWLIIDSCIDSKTSQPSAIQYLKSISVDPSQSVRQVIATHWHDDHVKGLAKVFGECQSADFVCSEALRTDEFLQLVMAHSDRFMSLSGLTSGMDEFRETLNEAKKRNIHRQVIKFAVADRCIWKSSIGAYGSECTVHALSPSDAALIHSKLQIAELLPKVKETKKRTPALLPNRAAVALWFSRGSLNILLGSDLEEEGQVTLGWSAVVTSQSRPAGKAAIFKVPHHGSETSHNDAIWSELLDSQPVAVLTPYKKGSFTLPTVADVERICSLTKRAYITAEQAKGKMIKRDKTVERTIRETVRDIRQVYSKAGHIRLRIRPGSSPNIELFDGAQILCKSVAT